jgi:ParB-like chromosome segregation protein Spo0J
MARPREDFGQKRAAELKPIQINVQDIETGGRLRPLSPKGIAKLKESISTIGLQTPITVRQDLETGVYHLISGMHRLKAMQELGIEFIEAFITEWDEIKARKWEIAENLHRADLTKLQRDKQIAEWIRLTGDDLQSAQVEPVETKRADGRGHRRQSGVKAAARELGIDRNEAQRAVKVDKITPEAEQAIIEAGLDNNHSALLAVAAVEPELQCAKVIELSEHRDKEYTIEDAHSALRAIVRKLSPADRARFQDSAPDIIQETFQEMAVA